MADIPVADVSAAIQPLGVALGDAGVPMMQGTVTQDRGTLSTILNVTAGNLTTGFAANQSSQIVLQDVGQLALFVEITLGTATNVELRLQARHGNAGTDYQESSLSVAAGVATVAALVYRFTAGGNHQLRIPVDALNYAIVEARGTGTLTTTTVAVYAVRAVEGQ